MHCPSATNTLTQVCMSTIGRIMFLESKLSRRRYPESNEEGRRRDMNNQKKKKRRKKRENLERLMGRRQGFLELVQLIYSSFGTND